jgi:hypothetical protein
MDTTVICKQIDYLALARRQQRTADPTFEEGARRKAKVIRKNIQELRKLALKRRGLAWACLAQEADALDEALNCALVSTADA